MSALLEVQGLSVSIPQYERVHHPVRDVSLSVTQGETLGIVGESGCGKSMSVLAIMRLLPKHARLSAQRIDFQGSSLLSANERQMSEIRGDGMSMIFQDPMTSLNPCYRIGDQLTETYLCHRHSASRVEARKRALYLLERVGIPSARERLKHFPHQLSGGIRQRVMIAMALMCSPKLLIADEPTTALDVTIQVEILQLLKSIQSESKIAIVFITHDLSVIARTAHRIAVMYAGQQVEMGPTDLVYLNPLHPYTRALLNCIPTKDRYAFRERLTAIPGSVPDLRIDWVGCPFRFRCSYSSIECESDIELTVMKDGRAVRCRLYSAGERQLGNER